MEIDRKGLEVGYGMDGESIVIETGRGTTLRFGTSGSVVAFEVDTLHEHGHSSWTAAARATSGSSASSRN